MEKDYSLDTWQVFLISVVQERVVSLCKIKGKKEEEQTLLQNQRKRRQKKNVVLISLQVRGIQGSIYVIETRIYEVLSYGLLINK